MVNDEIQQKQIICTHQDCNNRIDSIENLTHIASCDICAASYAAMIEQNSIIKSPHYMKANILEKIHSLEAVKKSNHRFEKMKYFKQLQLIRYSLKVGFAMCGALAMLFLFNFNYSTTIKSNPFLFHGEQRERTNTVSNMIKKMNHEIRVFSNNMVEYADNLVSDNNLDLEEDNNNEKEKK